ncbi:MAG: hypothetical protein FWC41_10305 [Firmicutes bacterium]|nr:hypothetical protein [Bacillota bacterium]
MLSGFWFLLILILTGNALQLFYVGRLEDELDNLYEILRKEGYVNGRGISNYRKSKSKETRKNRF